MKFRLFSMVTVFIMSMVTMSVVFASPSDVTPSALTESIVIEKGANIKVQAVDTVHSRKSKQNDVVLFKVIEDIKVGDITVIPANIEVEGIVTKVKKPGPWDQAGQLEVTFSEIKTKEADSIPVAGVLYKHGKKPNFFVRYSICGVFIKGKDAIINSGTEVTLQVKEDTIIRNIK
ncbi:MAG: hypothetical protein H6Q72_3971 [Firmicutes bacterium]|nr:hypothetical protein [Bacillota bacterium]